MAHQVWKNQATHLDKTIKEQHGEAFAALRSLCRTLGIRIFPGNSVVECIRGIDAEMKKRLAGR